MNNNLLQLKRDKKSKVDEKIAELISWCSSYPDLKVFSRVNQDEILKKYATTDEEYEELKNQFNKMQKNYEMLRERKSRGQLSHEQIEKCIDGNIRGTFINYSQNKELYGLDKKQSAYLIKKYGSMENYYEEFFQGNCDEFKDVFRTAIAIDGEYAYDDFMAMMFGRGNIYSSEAIKKQFNQLTPNETEIIKELYERKKTPTQIAKERSITSIRINQLRRSAIRKLKAIPLSSANISGILKIINEPVINKDIIEIITKSGMVLQQKCMEEQKTFELDEKTKAKLKVIKLLASCFERISIYNKKPSETIMEYFSDKHEIILNSYLSGNIESIKSICEEAQRKAMRDTDIRMFNFSDDLIKKLKTIGINKLTDFEEFSEEELRRKAHIAGKNIGEVKRLMNECRLKLCERTSNNLMIENVGFPQKITEILIANNIKTLFDLTQMTEEYLKKIIKIHGNALATIKNKMAEYGVTLKEKTIDSTKAEESIYISDMDFPRNIMRILMRLGINTIQELRDRVDEDNDGNLFLTFNDERIVFGKSTQNTIKEILESHNIPKKAIAESQEGEGTRGNFRKEIRFLVQDNQHNQPLQGKKKDAEVTTPINSDKREDDSK